ncbi:MAG TPA: glycosyltransferase family 4 protein [Alphaproteobacteria bacterium]|nr:glycosyltransferase family 4 protein [Alphaproteobacteria bacterium]
MTRRKVIFVLPHTYEPFFPKLRKNIKDIKSLDHFSTRYIDFMIRHTNKYNFELLAISSAIKKPLTIKHNKGFTIKLFPKDFPKFSPLPLETSESMLEYIMDLCKSEEGKNKELIWHINSYYLLMSDPISIILRKYKQNFALHHRGAGFSIKTLPYSIYKYWIMNRIIFKFAKLVVAENKDEEKKLLGFYKLPKNKVMYAPNPVDLVNVKKSKSELRKELDLPKDKTILMYAGRLMKGKGSGKAAKAIIEKLQDKNNKNLYFLIIGSGECSKEIKNAIAEAKEKHGASNCKLIDWVVKEDLFKYYHASDLFLHTNRNVKFEGTPNALIECQGAGLPVVGFNIGGVRDIIKTGYNGELELSNDFYKYSARVVKLAKNKTLLKKMSKNSIKNYHDNYDAGKILKTYERIYDTLSQN